jgi:hypothetical protein
MHTDTTAANATVDVEDVSDDEDEDEDPMPRRSTRQNKGQQRARPYDEFLNESQFSFFSHAKDVSNAKPVDREDWMDWALDVALMQYSIKAGLKKFGERGEAAVTKELKQLHDMETFFPVDASTLTKQDKAKAIASLMFLKEKRNGDIKGRACADGRKQREDFTKQDATSPTVSVDSIFLTAIIEAQEGRDVACFDIPGAFLHAETDEDVTMMLKGRLAELMVLVEPALYRKYVTVDSRGQPILYVKMHKALYGMLRSALLFYRKLVKDLEQDKWIINPYDPCVANRIINGKQQTVLWHVDDLRVSHVDPEVNTEFGRWLTSKYGDCKEHRGKHHEYLGMDFDYSEKGKVKVRMIPYLQSILDDFPEEIVGTKSTPAADYLFKVRDESETKKLPEEQAASFHRTTAKLVFVQARARRDIQTSTAFLTTRVKQPDEDDWGKLKRVLQYLKGTLHMPLVLSADSMTLPKWWVDASHGVHMDCKGQSGAMVSFGKGAPISFSRKQKLNTRSSTESELVGVDDAMPTVTWTRYFLEEQGYDMQPSLLYQDNKSAILLEENGRASSSKRTKHINVRYYFVKDKIEKGEVRIEHCPTEEMWADFNTKPRQGRGFMLFRSHLMGIEEDYDEAAAAIEWQTVLKEKATANPAKAVPMTSASPQECVGDNTDKENRVPRVVVQKGKMPMTNDTSLGSRKLREMGLTMVRGRLWSQNIYRNARRAGLSVDAAWMTSFVK